MAVMEFGQSLTSSQNPVVNLLTRVIYLHSLMQLLNETLEGEKKSGQYRPKEINILRA